MTLYAPIAIFGYNRPRHIKRALESLKQNAEFKESPLYVFLDGERDSYDAADVKAVNSVLEAALSDCSAEIVRQNKNWGLSDSVIRGVTHVLNRHPSVIVVEDDLEVSPYFLKFMNDALNVYRDNKQIMHISGYLFEVSQRFSSLILYRHASSWGWATWRRAWSDFNPDGKILLEELTRSGRIRSFDIEGSAKFYKMLKKQVAGKNDSWAVRWNASIFIQNGLCLYPYRSLVRNMGHDGSGVHCRMTHTYDVDVSREAIAVTPVELRENRDFVQAMMQYYKVINRNVFLRVFGILQRVCYKFRKRYENLVASKGKSREF